MAGFSPIHRGPVTPLAQGLGSQRVLATSSFATRSSATSFDRVATPPAILNPHTKFIYFNLFSKNAGARFADKVERLALVLSAAAGLWAPCKFMMNMGDFPMMAGSGVCAIVSALIFSYIYYIRSIPVSESANKESIILKSDKIFDPNDKFYEACATLKDNLTARSTKGIERNCAKVAAYAALSNNANEGSRFISSALHLISEEARYSLFPVSKYDIAGLEHTRYLLDHYTGFDTSEKPTNDTYATKDIRYDRWLRGHLYRQDYLAAAVSLGHGRRTYFQRTFANLRES